jgi:hypothetical protein
VADGWEGFRVIDVSTPSSPVQVGSHYLSGAGYGVAFSGGYCYVAAWSGGLVVFDVTTPSSPVDVGTHLSPGVADAVAVSVGSVFVAERNAGLGVFRDCLVLFADDFETSDTSRWSSTSPD